MSVPTAREGKPWRWRFRLRAGFGAIAAIALVLWLLDVFIREPYRAERRAAAELELLGGYVYLVDDTQGWVAKHLPPGLIDMKIAAIVDLNHSRVTDADLYHLKSFQHIGLISLSDTEIGNAGMEDLKRVVAGRFVDLSRTRVTDTSALFGNGRLGWPSGLRLSGNRVAGGRILHAQPAWNPLQELDLSDTDADDQTLAKFPKGLVNLSKLDLSGTQVTDAGLASLSRLENLTSLDLTGSRVTPEGVARFRAGWKGSRPLKVATGATRLPIGPYVSARPK